MDISGKIGSMQYLRSIKIKEGMTFPNQYPFSLPLVRQFQDIKFNAPVTFFVGENGSGKSTLLEAIAAAVGSITVGSDSVSTDATLQPARNLARWIKLIWNKRTHKGFFLRAEDFFGYAKRLTQMKDQLQEDLITVDKEYIGKTPLAATLAKIPYARELADMEQRYGEGLENVSHGESFLTLFQSRFIPGGLYLLDEPEAPLSPLRQLSFLSLLKEMVQQDAQFIIATHSPIIMAFPGACILDFDHYPLQQVPYEDLQHVEIMRGFLDNPNAYLKHL